ncbi:MAG: hypothetical protein QOI38_1981 [Sphingomonadales bacterium]|jgi:hypothetical protein|nr:hypothetical protein [Sphingomonadales bacterium]
MRLSACLAAAALIGGCSAPQPLAPPAPGSPGGLPDDRTPIAEAPFAPTSAQGAANVAQTDYALIEARRFGEAWRLLADGARPRGASEADLAAAFADYAEYHAEVGAPGAIEGAAGSSFVEVPVLVYGRMRGGAAFSRRGTVQLRRCNDVPGCTEAQRRWRIYAETFEGM